MNSDVILKYANKNEAILPRKVLFPGVLRSARDAFGNVPAQFEGKITLLTQKQDNIFILERLSGVIIVELAMQKCLPLKIKQF